MASCPYNHNHRFAKNKFIFHVTRCKDKLKVGHRFTTCKFNGLHIVLKDELLAHYQMCEDKARKMALLQATEQMKMEDRTKCEDLMKEEEAGQAGSGDEVEVIVMQKEVSDRNEDLEACE